MQSAPVASVGKRPTPQPTPTPLLHRHFERQVRKRPDHPAVEFLGESLSYQELDHYANRIANYLIAEGLMPGQLAGIYLKKSPRLYAVMLAILKAGGGYVPIDPKFPLERIQAIGDDANLKFIISEFDLADAIAGAVDVDLLRLDLDCGDIADQSDSLEPRDEVPPESLCYVIYTSGSTGRPKGVMIEHRNAVAFVETLGPVYRVSADDRVYQGFSVAFDASVEEIWAALSIGGTLVVPTEDVERSPSDVAQFINTHGVTYYSTVPTMLSMIDMELPTVRTLVLGGEACSDELVSRWAQPCRRMLNTYGPTEATVVATWAECKAGVPVTIGRALPGYSAHVLDEEGFPVAPGESGELYIGGHGVGRGYMNLPDLTNARFIPDPFSNERGARLYRTFDNVRLGDDGELQFLGRLDDQVKIRGFRIELSEIEAVLLSYPSIKSAAVGVVEVSQLKELAAFVVCDSDGAQLDRDDLAALLRRKVPPYMVPKYLDVVNALPMMASGKIDRKRLPVPESLFMGVGSFVAPATELEALIAEAWRTCFNLSLVSVEADFFIDMGGHSLLAAQCVNRFRSQCSAVSLSVRDIYMHRTVRALARELERRGAHVGDVHALRRDGARDQTHESTLDAGSDSDVLPVGAMTRSACAIVQFVVAMIYYGIIAAPIAYAGLMYAAVHNAHISIERAISVSVAVGFATWPSFLLISIAVKWIVIGRYKPGRYPLWGSYYLRWWIATRFQSLSWSEMFSGSPLMSLYWRAMGARVGRNVTLSTPICMAFDMIKVGDGSSIGLETQMLGCRVDNGQLVIAPVSIGRDCFVGMHCNLGLNSKMEDGALLDDMSLVGDNVTLPSATGWRGAPAKPAEVAVPDAQGSPPSRMRVFAFGCLHLGLIYAMGYFLLATLVPSLVLIGAGFHYWGTGGLAAALIGAVPLAVASYVLGAILVGRMLGRFGAGSVKLHTISYLRHWFLAYLIENTKTILNSAYATIYFPSFLRALGAKVGKGSEISTVAHITPQLLSIGDGCFLADACLVGGNRIHNGIMNVGWVQILEKTFIGNSALVPGGITVGRNTLIGVGSTPPEGTVRVPDDTRWLGSPGFELPRTQQGACFEDEKLFQPSRSAVVERAVTDAVRIVLPGYIVGCLTLASLALLIWAYTAMPLWLVIAIVPIAAISSAYLSVIVVAAFKWSLQGRLKPLVAPLWCRFVWRNELVNGIYESVAASAMAPLLGTPMVSPLLRMMGCRIGRWCYIETTLFSEFDLVEIGDRACLNLGGTIQTHLFEDRVFKADRLRIGDNCSVGNMAIVLYGTDMQQSSRLGPLSVLMKGETLPPSTSWAGIPCEQAVAMPTAVIDPAAPALDIEKGRAFEQAEAGLVAVALANAVDAQDCDGVDPSDRGLKVRFDDRREQHPGPPAGP